MRNILAGKTNVIKRVLKAASDALVIIVCTYLSLFIRFDFKITQVDFQYLDSLGRYLPFNIVMTILVFYLFRLYHSIWSLASILEMSRIFLASLISSAIQVVGILLIGYRVPVGYYLIYTSSLFVLTLMTRFMYRSIMMIRSRVRYGDSSIVNTMIIGAGHAAGILIQGMDSETLHQNRKICCLVDDAPEKQGSYIQGVKVMGTREDILSLASKYKIDEIIISIPSATKENVAEIIDICNETKCDLKIFPGVYQMVNGEHGVGKLRKVKLEDLLGRSPVEVDLVRVKNNIRGKVILVTGGGGSIGSEICRQIAMGEPKQLIVLDEYENGAYDLQQEIVSNYPELDLVVLIASVRNREGIYEIFNAYRPDIVYHAAAHKHVPLMEASPNEAIINNVFGTVNTVMAADKFDVRRFVMISTDKAVNPTNIMGASKCICEMIIQVFNKYSATDFVAVRFGNVLGSNGSVIPLFEKQIANGGPVTVTHPDITRYFMTIPEAVSLVLEAGEFALGGEIFILDMGEPVKVLDLAVNIIRLSGLKPYEDIRIEFTGLRPGEKMFEELIRNTNGLGETPNRKIHVEQPFEIDMKTFIRQLKRLKRACYNDTADIRKFVQQIVPTYRYGTEETNGQTNEQGGRPASTAHDVDRKNK
ncbi:polysaccharide biosynthesis protein [Parasporobacterium paucivorans]|uniref:NDP-sugar epimerase, includes UDP-GlcNAc-inverting 4,6-dehydratase FlaA1 and capsular polysaccharide biosynthesis protein EpsC n=1 Tax=Parasporobacterium paucivorans DSM 15970 TaxID=1122934 RepID=A0A1M6GU59_9FIRM|nr:nucleoside-diphosphate sugar epimerase/dehydratase [Parasporobacterium paucivorans]SHJ13463.1 NDP-sugar epimerase, includes UDP-GlcNAc-inverting 4,6-dehydratase FlaA1 and capsular polysaccharide biosynthesis protein EpsC [Parasporobacterium paucivorans DSM 15970]